MAIKKKPVTNPSIFSPLIDSIKDNIIGAIGKMIRDKILHLEKMVLEIALSFVFLAVAVFFFLAALVFFLKEYVGLNYALSFFWVGVAALILALIVYEIAKKK